MRVALIASLAALAFGLTTASAATSQRPALRVESTTPFTVVGTHFVPGERVRVMVESRGPHSRTVTARATGRFTAVFRGVAVEDCSGYLVVAIGSRGSRARLSFMPECPQPPAP